MGFVGVDSWLRSLGNSMGKFGAARGTAREGNAKSSAMQRPGEEFSKRGGSTVKALVLLEGIALRADSESSEHVSARVRESAEAC